MKRYIPIILLACILLLGASVRFIGLGQIPSGIIDDEADAAYDAYSLIHTGKDQWGVSWPLTSFRGFGDYRLPVYTYLAVPSIKSFGLTPFAVRFPAALLGTLTIIAVYLLVRELYGFSSKWLPLLSAFFLSISPWHIGMSRIGLEETASVFFVTVGMLLMLRGRIRPKFIIAGAVFLGLSLYVYTANIVLVPLLFGLLVYLFRKDYIKHKGHTAIATGIVLLLFAGFFVSASTSTAATRTRQVNLTNSSELIDVVNEKQGACVQTLPRPVCRLVFNKYNAYAVKFISNYFNHFSPNLLGVDGTNTQYSILPERGLLYLFDYPLLVVSLIVVFLTVSPAGLLLVGWLFLSAIPDSLTSDGQYGRFFVSYPVWPILIALAITALVLRLKKKKMVITLLVLLYMIAAAAFVVEYNTFFPYKFSTYSHFGYEELIGHIQTNMPSYDRIIVSSRVNDAKQYIYYLFYTRYDPAAFQAGKGIEKLVESDGWVRVKRINTLEFLPSLPSTVDIGSDHVLLIGSPTEFPKKILTQFTVKDKQGDVVFVGVDSKILYPAPADL